MVEIFKYSTIEEKKRVIEVRATIFFYKRLNDVKGR